MLFSSIIFLYYFLPITMIIYWIIPSKYKNIFCFLSSLFFYAWGEPVYVLVMLLSTFVNYIFGIMLNNKSEEKQRKKVLISSVIFNIGMLFLFKYTGFLLSNLYSLLNLNLSVPQIRLPLGISFFTFQALSYVIDVYRYDAKPQYSFTKIGLYISAYPQLIAGPIVRYNTIMDQIESREINIDKVSSGIFRFSIGLGKKVILANQFGILADRAFVSGISPSTSLGAWLGIIAYSFQIYYDFSGYSDMAIGLGRMLGFEYEENFNYPYISKSITDFWRRWHISLGKWFRDYLYIPLGGNKVSKSRHILNLFIVWTLTGFWHGSEWTFIAWGIYYFALLLIEKYFVNLDKIPNAIRHISTLILILIGWVLFRAETFNDAWNYILAMFNLRLGNLDVVTNAVNLNDYWYLFIIAVVGATPLLKTLAIKLINKKEESIWIKVFQSTFVVVTLIWITMYLVNSTYNPFIYFRF